LFRSEDVHKGECRATRYNGKRCVSDSEASFHYLSDSAQTPHVGNDEKETCLRRQVSLVFGLEAGLGTTSEEPHYVGHRYGYGADILFGIQTVDRRQHVYVIGKTGSGKTTVLRNLLFSAKRSAFFHAGFLHSGPIKRGEDIAKS